MTDLSVKPVKVMTCLFLSFSPSPLPTTTQRLFCDTASCGTQMPKTARTLKSSCRSSSHTCLQRSCCSTRGPGPTWRDSSHTQVSRDAVEGTDCEVTHSFPVHYPLQKCVCVCWGGASLSYLVTSLMSLNSTFGYSALPC